MERPDGGAEATACRALVIGASSGIGRQVGLRLAGTGADVVFHGRRADRLAEAVAEAGCGHMIAADLEDPASCEALVRDAVTELGGLDVIVYAASASRLGLVRDLTAADWARLYAINVISPALVFRAALPSLAPSAICAFISSESVGMPYQGLIPYGSSKAALEEVVRGMRVEHPELRFSCIRVGQTMPTDFARDFDLELAGELLPKWIALGRIPAQSMDVEEVGRVIAASLTTAIANPTVELQDMTLRAPGGVFSGGADSMLDEIDDVRASTGAEPASPRARQSH